MTERGSLDALLFLFDAQNERRFGSLLRSLTGELKHEFAKLINLLLLLIDCAAKGGVLGVLLAAKFAHRFDEQSRGAAFGDELVTLGVLFHPVGEHLLDFLSNHPKTRIVGKSTTENRAPTVSFTVSDQSSMELASKLGAKNIGVGLGHCYAYRLIEALGIDIDDGVVRTSLVHYTSEAEVNRLTNTLDELL